MDHFEDALCSRINQRIKTLKEEAQAMKSEYVNTVRRSEMSHLRKAAREMEDYCMLHPRTPAAVRRPRISKR